MSVNKNGYNVPDFMDVAFFERALRACFQNPETNIGKVLFTGGTKPGENFCSVILRATITYFHEQNQSETIPVIVKYLSQDSMAEFFKPLRIFNREHEMYTEVLPKMKDILNGDEMAPRYLYYTDDPTDVIIFEDVNPLGFKVENCMNGLNEDHCALVFEMLGRFHAASMVLAAKFPAVRSKFKDSIKFPLEEREEGEKNFFVRHFRFLAKTAATWPGFEEIVKKLDRFIPSIPSNYDDWCGPMEGEIKVLAHNDMWTNNILFKYDETKPVDLYFIDYQIAFFSSPGIDLTHFLYTSPEYQVLEQKRDYLVEKCYYESFKSTLLKLGHDSIPTLEDILDEIRKREIVGFMWTVTQLFVACIDENLCSEKNMETIQDPVKGEKLLSLGMTSERFTCMMKYILKRMEEVGILK